MIVELPLTDLVSFVPNCFSSSRLIESYVNTVFSSDFFTGAQLITYQIKTTGCCSAPDCWKPSHQKQSWLNLSPPYLNNPSKLSTRIIPKMNNSLKNMIPLLHF